MSGIEYLDPEGALLVRGLSGSGWGIFWEILQPIVEKKGVKFVVYIFGVGHVISIICLDSWWYVYFGARQSRTWFLCFLNLLRSFASLDACNCLSNLSLNFIALRTIIHPWNILSFDFSLFHWSMFIYNVYKYRMKNSPCPPPHGWWALPIYCSIPMLEPQGYGFCHVLSLLRVCFS